MLNTKVLFLDLPEDMENLHGQKSKKESSTSRKIGKDPPSPSGSELPPAQEDYQA
jgi:hypothetical protein